MMYKDEWNTTHLSAALTCVAYERQITKISCTPANARLSSVQSSSGALQIGSRHCRDRRQHPSRSMHVLGCTDSWFAPCQRPESLVEAVGEDNGLQDLIVVADQGIFGVRLLGRHFLRVVSEWILQGRCMVLRGKNCKSQNDSLHCTNCTKKMLALKMIVCNR